MLRSVIRSTGAYLPKKVVTNKDLEKIVETNDEWIVQRTGIKERRIAGDTETTGSMAIEAGRQALKNAGLTGADIGAVIVATTTPDKIFPSVAVNVQQALGIPLGPAFDIQAVCSGFVYALAVANNFITAGQAKRILVIGAEKMSSVIDWEDRTTCVLFADGAGSVILEAAEGAGTLKDRGVISTHLYANGAQQDLLYADTHIVMQGKEVFKYAVQYMADVVKETLETNKITGADIDWMVPHQANIRIIESTADKLKLPMSKVIVTVDKHGNTSAASIPLALHEGVTSGRIKKGHLLLLEAMGGGFTWGAALIRF